MVFISNTIYSIGFKFGYDSLKSSGFAFFSISDSIPRSIHISLTARSDKVHGQTVHVFYHLLIYKDIVNSLATTKYVQLKANTGIFNNKHNSQQDFKKNIIICIKRCNIFKTATFIA